MRYDEGDRCRLCRDERHRRDARGLRLRQRLPGLQRGDAVEHLHRDLFGGLVHDARVCERPLCGNTLCCMFLRIYANCRDDEAAAMASAIEVALVPFELTQAAVPRQYWKMPELFEFTYRLSSQTRSIWDALVAQSPGGWEVFGDSEDRSAVWNRSDDRVFLAPAVRWAELTERA
jgi:hypothetical protein